MQTNAVQVKNVKVTSLAPKVKDPDVAALLPTVLVPERTEMEIHGVNTAIANGLRRVITSESPAWRLNFDHASFHTNDPFILVDYIRKRINNIPIKQDTSAKLTFRLNVLNNTDVNMRVKTGLMEPAGKAKPVFNETFDVCMLGPGKYITIDNIYLQRGYGYMHGGYNMACNVAAVPLDQTPLDTATGVGVPSGLSDPRVHRLAFTTNGTISNGEIMKIACDEIATRLDNVIKSIPNVYNADDTYHLVLKKETHTIGNILMKSIVEEYPDVPAVTYTTDELAKTTTISIRTTDDIETMLIDVCKKNIKIVNTIKAHFK